MHFATSIVPAEWLCRIFSDRTDWPEISGAWSIVVDPIPTRIIHVDPEQQISLLGPCVGACLGFNTHLNRTIPCASFCPKGLTFYTSNYGDCFSKRKGKAAGYEPTTSTSGFPDRTVSGPSPVRRPTDRRKLRGGRWESTRGPRRRRLEERRAAKRKGCMARAISTRFRKNGRHVTCCTA